MRRLVNDELRLATDSGGAVAMVDARAAVWARKPVLREIYGAWYERLRLWIPAGHIVEVGAGTGNLAMWLAPRRVFTLDLPPTTAVDAQADAERLPFRSGSVDAFIMFDVLHHLRHPVSFLHEASRALADGGRVIVVEPFVSPWGRVVYGLFHHEHAGTGTDATGESSGPWQGSAGVSRWLLDEGARGSLPLDLVAVEYGDVLAYPLSGGFSYRSILPASLLRRLHAWERHAAARSRWTALRIMAVLAKRAS